MGRADRANSAVGRYAIALAKQAGVRTLNVVRRPEVAADLVAPGADAVVVSGPDLAAQLAAALGNDRISLVLDAVGGDAVTELAHSLVKVALADMAERGWQAERGENT